MADPLDLDALRAVLAKMTPGPWEAGGVVRHALTFDYEANIFPPLGESPAPLRW